NRIALKYKTRYVNEPLEIYYPAPDGWGKNSAKIRARSPLGTRHFYKEFVSLPYPIPRRKLLREYANYVRYSMHARIGLQETVREIPQPGMCLLAWPAGAAAYLRDRRLITRS